MDTNKDLKIANLISKYILCSEDFTNVNTISLEDKLLLDNWIKENPQLFKQIIEDNKLSDKIQAYIDDECFTNESWEKLNKEISISNKKSKSSFIIFTNSFVKYAAILILLISGAYFLIVGSKDVSKTYKKYTKVSEVTLTMGEANSIQLSQEEISYKGIDKIALTKASQKINKKIVDQGVDTSISYNTISVPTGKTFKITLSDSTVIEINSNSQITFPNKFVGGKRVVELVGEAIFTVKHDDNNPFYVRTSDLDIKDIGTIFNVCAYKNEEFSEVTLIEGSCEVSSQNFSKVLKPNYKLIYENKQINITKVETKNIISWKTNMFQYQSISLLELTRVLSRWYGVKFLFTKSKLEDVHFGLNLPKSKSIDEILKYLELSYNINFSKENNTYLIQ